MENEQNVIRQEDASIILNYFEFEHGMPALFRALESRERAKKQSKSMAARRDGGAFI
jgi:hypothetical protein